MYKVETMKCKKCRKKRIILESGTCLICEPNIIHGVEVREEVNTNVRGTKVISRTGRVDENDWRFKF